MQTVNIKKLTETATIPLRGSEYAAGYDLYADLPNNVTIRPHQTVKINTGIAIALPQNTFGAIFARSGLASREGLRPANCVGVIDEDYRGELIIALHNDTDYDRTVEPGERVAQLVILPYVAAAFNEVSDLDNTERGNGGFGSTGRA